MIFWLLFCSRGLPAVEASACREILFRIPSAATDSRACSRALRFAVPPVSWRFLSASLVSSSAAFHTTPDRSLDLAVIRPLFDRALPVQCYVSEHGNNRGCKNRTISEKSPRLHSVKNQFLDRCPPHRTATCRGPCPPGRTCGPYDRREPRGASGDRSCKGRILFV